MDRSRSRVVSILAIAALLGGVSATAATQTAQAIPQVARAASNLSPNPSSTTNDLTGVSAVSPTDAWAVGSYQKQHHNGFNTLVVHWDGSSWTKVKSPGASSSTTGLSGVSAVSTTDAWAVGAFENDRTGAHRTLILHWDGTSWSKVKSPNPSTTLNYLNSVSADSATDAWAVGDYGNNITGAVDTLILHWNGTSWSRVKSPKPSTSLTELRGVRADSPTDSWAVGDYINDTTGVIDTLILHWDGASWSRVKSPNPSSGGEIGNELDGVSADSATDAWAVGEYQNATTRVVHTLVVHWDGASWTRVRSPSPSTISNLLTGVSADSGTDAWAVGYRCGKGCHKDDTLILHWNGTAWSKVSGPQPSSIDNFLLGVNAVSATDAWAVGEYQNDTTGAGDTLIVNWNGTSWTQT